jgi:hypothetical protein
MVMPLLGKFGDMSFEKIKDAVEFVRQMLEVLNPPLVANSQLTFRFIIFCRVSTSFTNRALRICKWFSLNPDLLFA